MNNDFKASTLGNNHEIITLRGYYKGLPNANCPKSDFIRNVAFKCKVTESTVRNWINYGMKPNDPEHISILSEMTGIPRENLFKNDRL